METTIIITYNLTNPEDNMGLPTYCRELLKKNKNTQITVINIELAIQQKEPKQEKYEEHNITTYYSPLYQFSTDNELTRKITTHLQKIQQTKKIKKIILPDFLFQVYLDNEFLTKNNIKKIMFIHLLQRGLLDAATRYKETRESQYLKELIVNSHREYLTTKMSDEFICNSEFTKKELQKHYAETTQNKKIHTTQLGINKEYWEYTPQLKKPITTFFGRLDIQKGMFFIIKDIDENQENYQKNPLTIIGEQGEYNDALQTCANEKTIIKINDLQKQELKQELKKTKYCIFPSIYEPWCQALTEAMAMGKICIIHNAESGMREQIKHKENGFIIDFEKQSIIKYIEELEESNTDFEKIAQNARKTARDFNEHYEDLKKHL